MIAFRDKGRPMTIPACPDCLTNAAGPGILSEMTSSTFTTPVEIDTEMARRDAIYAKAAADFTRIHDARMGDDSYLRHRYSNQDYYAAEVAVEQAGRELREIQDLYTGWPRYFHVTNGNGHIHTSMSCTSCFPTTTYVWRTDLSGLSPKEVVDREAYNACSVCMPIAPAEQRAARVYYNREQREKKQAEKDAKKAEKHAKALDRARKHAVKVEKTIIAATRKDTLAEALASFRDDFSLYGHDGQKSVYDIDAPPAVHNTLYAIKSEQENNRSLLYDLNAATREALTERGIL